MSKWHPVGLPIRDFWPQAKVGMVIEVKEYGDEIKQYLIGHLNAESGSCDCCGRAHYDTEIVIRYRNINWETP